MAERREAHPTVLAPDRDRALAGQQAIDQLDRQALFVQSAGIGGRCRIFERFLEIFTGRYH